MQVTICERGCGRTSLDSDAAIETLHVAMRTNGNEETAYKATIEVCRYCREITQGRVTDMFTAVPIRIQVQQ